MKLLNFLLAVLMTVSIMAASARAEVLWSEDFESYETGTELVGTVEGWHFSSADYTGTSTIVEGGDGKVLKLSKVSGQSDKAYDMIFTPLMKICTENKARELTKISFKFRPGSGTRADQDFLQVQTGFRHRPFRSLQRHRRYRE